MRHGVFGFICRRYWAPRLCLLLDWVGGRVPPLTCMSRWGAPSPVPGRAAIGRHIMGRFRKQQRARALKRCFSKVRMVPEAVFFSRDFPGPAFREAKKMRFSRSIAARMFQGNYVWSPSRFWSPSWEAAADPDPRRDIRMIWTPEALDALSRAMQSAAARLFGGGRAIALRSGLTVWFLRWGSRQASVQGIRGMTYSQDGRHNKASTDPRADFDRNHHRRRGFPASIQLYKLARNSGSRAQGVSKPAPASGRQPGTGNRYPPGRAAFRFGRSWTYGLLLFAGTAGRMGLEGSTSRASPKPSVI